MEFKNQCLSSEEYKTLGGTLGEMPFNILELKARQIINERTQNRLKNVEDIPVEVKVCVYHLVNIASSYQSKVSDVSVASESTDGYSISYKSGTDLTEEQKKQYDDVMETDLYGVIVNGEAILYLGANRSTYKGEWETC